MRDGLVASAHPHQIHPDCNPIRPAAEYSVMVASDEHKQVSHAMSDAQVIHESVEHPARFRELFARHGDAVFRFAAFRIGPDHAEDIVSDTFSIAFDKRATFHRSAPSARPWLYGIAANRLLKHHEAERRWLERSQLEPAAVEEPTFSLAHARVDASRMAPELATALLELTPIQRSVLLLFALEDLTHEEIAQALGIRPGTAKSHLSRGRARLRDILPYEKAHHV